MKPVPRRPPSRRPRKQHAFEAAHLALARIHLDRDKTLHDALRAVTEIAAKALRVHRCGVWLMADDRRSIRCELLYQPSGDHVYEGVMLQASDFPSYFDALKTRRAIPATDAARDPATHQLEEAYLKPLGIGAMLDVPVYRGGAVMGVVCHEHLGNARTWTEPEQNLVATVGITVSRLFEESARRQAEHERDRYRHHAENLHRLEALGRLAVSVAHDFRNILQIVQTNGELILLAGPLAKEPRDALGQIIKAVGQGQALTAELLALGRNAPDSPRVVDPKTWIRSIEKMLRISAGPQARLTVTCQRRVSSIFVDPSRLERVLINLVLNARDAMPRGGTIHVEVGESEIAHGADHRANSVVLNVRDTGQGMDAATQARMFDPFFSTKGERGTGLGLAIVDQIVTRAGGHVEVESQVGRGTTIRLFLPPIAAGARDPAG